MRNYFNCTKHQVNSVFDYQTNTIISSRQNNDMIYYRLLQSYQYDAWGCDTTSSNNCYDNLYSTIIHYITLTQTDTRNSFVIRLTRFLIMSINDNFIAFKNRHLGKEFYDHCENSFIKSDIIQDIQDLDLLLIYLKQLVIIFRDSDLLCDEESFAKAITQLSSNDSIHSIFPMLFISFWNRVNWEEIFPSIPEAAKKLKENRTIMINLLINQSDSFRIDKISNDFFRLTGFGKKNDLCLLSFLDFYFFTWLSFFGIIRYLDGAINEPVTIKNLF